MDSNKDVSVVSTAVKNAIGCLIAGTTLAGCQNAPAPAPAPDTTKVTAVDISAPANPIVEEKSWKLVTIELTAHQKAEMARLGVKTDSIKIATSDISRLADSVSN